MPSRLRWLFALGIALFHAVPAAAQQLESFDSVWAIVQRTHFDTTFNGVDWRAAREEFRPRAASAQSNAELRVVLMEMLGRLGQSHFALLAHETTAEDEAYGGGPGELGMDVRFLDGDVVVVDVRKDGPADRAGVRRGWIVEQIDQNEMSTVVERARQRDARAPNAAASSVARVLLNGAVGSTATLRVRDHNDQTRTLRIERVRDSGLPVRLGNLPTFFATLQSSRLDTTPGGIGLIRFNAWMVPLMPRVDSAFDRFRNADGIVIDLRGNPGGVGAMSVGVANQIVDSAYSLGTMKTRQGQLHFRISPRRLDTQGQRVRPYDGPVAVLTDELTASTSEIFVVGLQALGRIRVFGQPTAGAALPAVLEKLPNGDLFMHAIADFVASDGTRPEGRGAIPEELVSTTRVDLLAGRDRVLEAAIEWIRQQRAVKPSTQGT